MAPRQGSKKTPHSFHSRSDSRLNENIQGTLILVLESGEFASDCNPKDIVRSNSAVFGDADAKQGTEEGKFVKSVTDKIRNLRLLKAEDPAEYWRIYSRALQQGLGDEGDEYNNDDEDEVPSPQLSTFASPPSSSRSRRHPPSVSTPRSNRETRSRRTHGRTSNQSLPSPSGAETTKRQTSSSQIKQSVTMSDTNPKLITYSPDDPVQHAPFIIGKFLNDKPPERDGEMHDGFIIRLERVDPGQLKAGMYEAFIDPLEKDCVIVRTPYLSHGSQCDGESCTDRAASLNANPRSVVVHREAHELALSTAYQQILDSGKPKIPTDGYRSLHYKIRFPEELSDKVFGKKGVLDLNTVGWKTTKGVNELLFDISWNASLLVDEEDPRYDKRPKANETDYLADAIQDLGVFSFSGMAIGSHVAPPSPMVGSSGPTLAPPSPMVVSSGPTPMAVDSQTTNVPPAESTQQQGGVQQDLERLQQELDTERQKNQEFQRTLESERQQYNNVLQQLELERQQHQAIQQDLEKERHKLEWNKHDLIKEQTLVAKRTSNLDEQELWIAQERERLERERQRLEKEMEQMQHQQNLHTNDELANRLASLEALDAAAKNKERELETRAKALDQERNDIASETKRLNRVDAEMQGREKNLQEREALFEKQELEGKEISSKRQAELANWNKSLTEQEQAASNRRNELEGWSNVLAERESKITSETISLAAGFSVKKKRKAHTDTDSNPIPVSTESNPFEVGVSAPAPLLTTGIPCNAVAPSISNESDGSHNNNLGTIGNDNNNNLGTIDDDDNNNNSSTHRKEGDSLHDKDDSNDDV